MGLIRNKDRVSTNPYLFAHTTLCLVTNQVIDVSYTVTAFFTKETVGYHRSSHDNYQDAKVAYDKLFEHHVETK